MERCTACQFPLGASKVKGIRGWYCNTVCVLLDESDDYLRKVPLFQVRAPAQVEPNSET